MTAVLQNKKQWQLLTVKTKQKIAGSIVESATPQLTNSGQTLLSRLSFTHFAELLEIQDTLKRVFYEVECIRGNWSVRELKRQIATLYYERTGLSRNKKKLASLVEQRSEKQEARLDHALVEYALAGMNNKLFVSKYQLELPKKEEMQKFIEEQMREVQG